MRIPVIKIMQKGMTLYIGRMTAEDLLRAGVTTEWDPALGWDLENQGYQRLPMVEHYKHIGEFLIAEGDPLLPTCALLSAREQDYGVLHFKPFRADAPDVGYLEVPDVRRLFIVDYQHRWRGFKYAIEEKGATGLNSFQVPVVIMADSPRYEEIRQFYLVNSKQRRVDTDLALALMQTMASAADESELINLAGPGKRYRIRATRLIFRLAALPTGCWVNRIQEPNIPPVRDQVASPKSFADSLRPILSSRCPLSRLSDDELIDIITDFWEGMRTVIPAAFESPQNYAIQKTPGLFSMHRVAAHKVLLICQREGDHSPQGIAAILRQSHTVRDVGFWATGSGVSAYGGASGHKALADRIMQELQ